MKKTTCRALRGACEAEILGATPEEMGAASKAHVMQMMEAGDQAHLDAVAAMKALSPEEQKAWYEGFLKGFDDLPDA